MSTGKKKDSIQKAEGGTPAAPPPRAPRPDDEKKRRITVKFNRVGDISITNTAGANCSLK